MSDEVEPSRAIPSAGSVPDVGPGTWSVLAALSEGVVIQAADGVVTAANPAALAVLGLTPDALVGRVLVDASPELIAEDGSPIPREAHPFAAIPRPGAPTDRSVVGVRQPDGPQRWASVGRQLLLVPGLAGQVVTTLGDITESKRIEGVLRRERDFRASVLATVASLVVVFDLDGRIVSFNRACEACTGYASAEIPDRPFWEFLLVPDEVEPVRAVWRELRTTGMPSHFVNFWVSRTGDRRLIEWSNTVLLGPDGSIEHVMSTGIDITDRERISEELRRAQDHQRRTMEEMAEGCLILAFDWTCVYVNRAAARHRHRTVDDLVGRSILENDPGVEGSEVFARYRRCMETRVPERFEASLSFSDGATAWYELSVQPAPEGIFVLSQDISSRKRAEETLRQSEANYRTLFEESLDGLFATSPDGRILDMNRTGVAIFGYDSKEEMLSLDLARDVYVRASDRARILATVNSAGTAEYDVDVRKRSGEVMTTHCSLVAARDAAGAVTAYRGVIRDVTEQRRAEQALQREEAERLAHLSFLESLDRVNRAMQGPTDVEEMTGAVLEELLSIFDCDRAWLIYPCDPDAPSWRVPMERTRPEYPGANALGVDIPTDPDVARSFRAINEAGGPLIFGPETGNPLPAEVAEQFGFKSFIAMALRPRLGDAWEFGLHQCSYERVWSAADIRLFEEVGRRLTDGLTGLLVLRNLREAESRQRLALHVGQIGTFQVELGSGQDSWSPEVAQIWGIPDDFDGSLSDYWWAHVHPDDLERVKSEYDAMIASPTEHEMEFRIARPDGTAAWVRWRGQVLENAAGGPPRVVGVNVDITDQRVADDALRDSEAKFAAAFHGSPAALSVTSIPDGRYLEVNDRFIELTGYPRAEIIGRTAAQLRLWVDPRDGREFQRLIREVGHVGNLDYAFRRRDGTVGSALASATVIIVKGDPCLLAQVSDVTERRAAEQAIRRLNAELEQRVADRTSQLQESNAELEAFSYSVSHDLRAPLRAIAGFSHVLLEDHAAALDAEASRVLRLVVANTDRMGHLIDDLLAFSRVSRTAFGTSAVDMATLARSVVDELGALEQGRLVTIEVEPLEPASGDAALLRQVFANLVANALKFTRPRPEPQIRVGSRRARGEVEYFVRDNGVGFDVAYAGSLFKVFSRLHPLAEFEGTGIGLAIVARIVRRHGGRVWAEGAVGQGATFWFALPGAGGAVDGR